MTYRARQSPAVQRGIRSSEAYFGVDEQIAPLASERLERLFVPELRMLLLQLLYNFSREVLLESAASDT